MARTLGTLLIALTVFASVLGSAHYYFVQRLVLDAGLPAQWQGVASATIVALGVMLVAHPVIERSLGPRVAGVTGWISYLWMGAAFYLLLGLGVSDAAIAIAGVADAGLQQTRALGVVGLTGVLVMAGLGSALSMPEVRRVEIPIPGWPSGLDGFRIVQMSDIHIGSLIRRRFAKRLAECCNALDPDLVAITGDLVDGSVHHLREEVAPLSQLRARHGVYFVTGNHDHYSGATRWVQRVSELGIEPLRNRRVRIGVGVDSFELAGVDDISSRRGDGRGYDMEAALEGWDRSSPLVLLSHDPRSFRDARRHGVHLQLSGHTHGGQMWPFGFFVRLQTPFLAGVYRSGGSTIYVSRGTGYWGPPMRVMAPAEITELVLRSGASPD